MPAIVYGAQNSTRPTEDLANLSFNYDYPLSSDGSMLNLKPGDPNGIHDELRDWLMEKARASHEAMAQRRASWDEVDAKLNVYIPLDEEEQRVKEKDARKPASIVVPTMFANLQTLCTYAAAAFAGDSPMWPLEARRPESKIGVIKLEMDLEWQRQRMAMLMDLTTQWRDAFAYGFGVVAPTWTREMAFQTVRKPRGVLDRLSGQFIQTGWDKRREQIVSFEGNQLNPVNPRLYLPDPNAPIHKPDQAEYIAWLQRLNVMDLLTSEQYAGLGLFNAKYVRALGDARSSLFTQPETGRADDVPEVQGNAVNPADIIWFHVKLIPRERKLGPEEYPERWLFGLAGDRVIVQAAKMNLDHEMCPVAVCAPNTDGRMVSPISILETGYGLQVFCDWMFSAHAENKRRAIYNQFVYDPSVINSQDIRNPKAGGLIRTRRAMWGRDLKTAIMQLPATDVTRDHVTDVSWAMDLQQRTMGTVDIVQGIMKGGSGDRSAAEARGVREAALSRLQHAATLISEQSMKRLAYLMAKQTQQLQSEEIFLRISGRWEQILAQEYGQQGYMSVSPFDILVDFDVVAKDGSIPNSDNANLWLQMYQVIVGNPALSMRYDIDRIFSHFARMAGANDVYAFRVPDIQAKVMDEAAIQQQVQAGNMATPDQIEAAA